MRLSAKEVFRGKGEFNTIFFFLNPHHIGPSSNYGGPNGQVTNIIYKAVAGIQVTFQTKIVTMWIKGTDCRGLVKVETNRTEL